MSNRSMYTPVTLLILMLLTCATALKAQEQIRLKIHLAGIDKDKLSIHFDDGLLNDLIEVKPEDTTVILERRTYSPYPRIFFFYETKSHTYLINQKNSTTTIYFDEKRGGSPFYADQPEHLTAVYDTVSCKIFRKLREDQKTEMLQRAELWNKYGAKIQTNDSAKFALQQLTKAMNAKSMALFALYPDDFSSFLYFFEQVVSPTLFIEEDAAHFTDLLDYYNRTFPEAYRTTVEGKKIAQDLAQKITPAIIKLHEPMPNLELKDIYGQSIPLKNQAEPFVLLDFWASWCGPCLAQIPDLQLLRADFSAEKLKIVGVSIDRDSTSFLRHVDEYQMNWTHSFDYGGIKSSSLGINSIPRVILLDRNGKILYYSTGGKLDRKKIYAILAKDE
ncbi:TlpA family protein disulfide reductase [Sphingobacterium bambusae]|uniref:TlpA family protein disulfide reductase n=1 Tax=Sphingobacterium bambusae TaxID=662858 RepID=A0ABW6BEP4_9SPHI|nr:TlpA disulfide reductase family protein [Sphingobacterium bambusae]WPL48778.1 TlpA disulfide reductase family protein [Sphingobacterium bambusae]